MLPAQPTPSPNFAYLAHHDARLVALATQAEQLFTIDPAATLMKLRLFAEMLAKRAAAKMGLYTDQHEKQVDLINRLSDRGVIMATQRTLFHDLRKSGNDAAHDNQGNHQEALHQLKMARELAIWFQRSFGNNRKFDPGPFVPPSEPKKPGAELHEELQRLRDEAEARKKDLAAAQAAIDAIKKQAEAEQAAKLTAEERAAKAREDAATWEALASEEVAKLEDQNRKLAAELAAVQAQASAMPAQELANAVEKAAEASEAIQLDETATRRLIDKQLRDAGWEVDSTALTFDKGVRPTKGKNVAIAEWPTLADGKEGWADYVLFAGLTPIAVVEAKRKHTDVPG